MDFHWLFFTKSVNNFPLVMHAQRQCLNLNQEQLFWFIGGQSHFSTSWHAKMGWTLNEPIWNVFVQTSTLPPRMRLKLTECGRYCMQFNQLHTKSHFGLQVLCSLHNCDVVTTLEVLDELNDQSKFILIVISRFYLLEVQLCTFECMRWRCRSRKR